MEASTGPNVCFIGELPDELLVLMISQLHVDRGFLADRDDDELRRHKNATIVHSLHALTLSCRKLHAIANPLLYQCVIQNQQRTFVPLLLRTLLHKPELGQHVHYIEFMSLESSRLQSGVSDHLTKSEHRKYYDCMKFIQWLAPAPETTEDLLDNDECTSHADSSRCRVRDLLRLNMLSALAFLLSAAANIQDAALPDSGPVCITLSYLKFTNPGRLRQLWLLSRGGSGHSLRVILANVIGRHGYLTHYLRRTYLDEHLWLIFGPPPPITEIALTIEDVPPSFLDEHLSYCASLERFSCRWQWTDSFVREPVDLPALWASLQKVKSTLTHLAIDTSESAWRVDMDQGIPALGSLRDFQALTHLDVAGLVLWGDNDFWESPPLSTLLPESLEMLTIKTEWDEDVEDVLHQMSIDCAISLPSLRKVECSWRPAPDLIADILIDAYRRAGVELILDIEDPSISG